MTHGAMDLQPNGFRFRLIPRKVPGLSANLLGLNRTPKRLRFVSLSASFGLFTSNAVLLPSPVASLCLGHACVCGGPAASATNATAAAAATVATAAEAAPFCAREDAVGSSMGVCGEILSPISQSRPQRRVLWLLFLSTWLSRTPEMHRNTPGDSVCSNWGRFPCTPVNAGRSNVDMGLLEEKKASINLRDH